ncbi:dTMP kinase [Buchnera aphidicola (Ceratoglyphina bambusae)]|uniref:dTMP kinase n=1 Tax=Buchnera aphidicola TaxID=9 RepID=UPI0031B84609
MKKNKFIVLEGIEGSGKSEMCFYLYKILSKNNINKVICVRQPGGTIICEKIRKIIKEEIKDDKIDKKTEILLLYASRIQLIENKIKLYLKNDYWVICDRHNLSTMAYQIAAEKKNKTLIKKLTKMLLKNFNPYLTIYLDVLPVIGLNRISIRGKLDRIEKKGINFFTKVRKNYLRQIKKAPNTFTINASLEKQEVKKKIKKKFIFWLKNEWKINEI